MTLLRSKSLHLVPNIGGVFSNPTFEIIHYLFVQQEARILDFSYRLCNYNKDHAEENISAWSFGI